MADKNSRYSDNVPGKFYVDDQCIGCDACIGYAPDFFEMNDDDMHSFVKRQPVTLSEISDCEEAIQVCPVDAIGNDG